MSGLGNKAIFAKNLNKYMSLTNTDRATICKTLNIAYSTFTDWCNGVKYPRIDKIEMLANYFGIQKSDLIEEPQTNDSFDPDIRRIQRARKKMSQEDKTKMMKLLKVSFEKYFSDDYLDDDNDE